MPTSEGFHELLFEVSNESRYEILVLLSEKPMRNTDISRELKLTSPETRRQVSRLGEVGLIQRDLDGYYHLTPYGEVSLLLFQEFHFLVTNRSYFQTHTTTQVPAKFVKRIGELGESRTIENPMDFLRHTENLLKESNEYVWLIVDQFPMNSLYSIVEAIERGIQFRVLEPRERVLNPNIEAMTSDETRALSRTRNTPLVDQRIVDDISVYLFLSEKQCVIAFPTTQGQYDYTGFNAQDNSSLKWCMELFQHYWDEAERRTLARHFVQIKRGPIAEIGDSLGQIVVIGRENPAFDVQEVQDAVNNYNEVVLRGRFNFGPSMVKISRSVIVKGEGQENDIPSTTIYKKGWRFPFSEFDSVFKVDGKGIDVTIENIQFTDFNHTCIWGNQCGNLSIENNIFTLDSGYGRGVTYGAFGDAVIGILVLGSEPNIFRGRVTIKGNQIDFARGGAFGGFLSRGGIEEDPEYRPDLFNHEYYMGFGIAVHQVSGAVNIENNMIRNANARGIAVSGNLQSADVRIKHNTIISDVYGSYPFSSHEAGSGILAQSAWGFPSPGFNVEIEENVIKLDRLNYSGVILLGPVMDREGVDKLRGGTIRNNRIQVKKGYEGIHVRKCDDFDVVGNTISGEAYYGIRISGRKKSGKLDLRALKNTIQNNDLGDLHIRAPDDYSDSHIDGRMFTGSEGKSLTGHVWLNEFTAMNIIKLGSDETVIDVGKNNSIERN
jgi:predicted transcriptional regulator